MTFDELVRKVTEKHKMIGPSGRPALGKTAAIIRDALELAAQAALTGLTAPVFPGIGRFVKRPVRSSGRKTDGTVWSKPGRVKLALSASKHVGGASRSAQRVVNVEDTAA